MKIEFDPDKDAKNQSRHHMSLAEAADFEIDDALVGEDTDGDYGEQRFKAIGYCRGRICVLVFTYRDDTVRAISLRAAEPKERRWYAGD